MGVLLPDNYQNFQSGHNSRKEFEGSNWKPVLFVGFEAGCIEEAL
jgi:hypothetical protein